MMVIYFHLMAAMQLVPQKLVTNAVAAVKMVQIFVRNVAATV
jgi:hypothetical protein